MPPPHGSFDEGFFIKHQYNAVKTKAGRKREMLPEYVLATEKQFVQYQHKNIM